MYLTNYHTHYSICDGKAEAREFVRVALEKGFKALGFSSHGPLPYENRWTMKPENLPRYLAEVRELKKEFAGRLEIYLGMEADYIEGVQGPSDPFFTNLGLDYIIGAMHIIRDPSNGSCRELDASEETYRIILEEDFKGDIRAFAAEYFRLVGDMTIRHRPEIIGHFDLIKKNNPDERYFKESEAWYRKTVQAVLPAVKASGSIVEVNTGGLARKRTVTVYPSPWILHELRKEEIPVMVNSDAHSPENLDAYYDEAIEAVKDAGYRKLLMLLGGRWQEISIE